MPTEVDEIKNVRDKQHAQSRMPAGETREKSEPGSLVSAPQSPDVNVTRTEADEIKNIRDKQHAQSRTPAGEVTR